MLLVVLMEKLIQGAKKKKDMKEFENGSEENVEDETIAPVSQEKLD